MNILTINNKAVKYGTQILTGLCSYIVVITNRKLATLTCGGQTYTLINDELQHIFAVNPGTYTCTASLTGYSTVSGSVTVTATDGGTIKLSLTQVPSEYQEVEYIKTYGNQYINTGRVMNTPADEYIGTIEILNVSGQIRLWGTGNNSEVTAWASGGYNWRYGGIPAWVATVDPNKHEWKQNSTGVFMDNVLQASYSSKPTATSTNTFCIFYTGINLTAKLYSFKWNSNGTPVYNFIPCYRKSDSVSGVYDTVSETFFTNAGTGTFDVGPDV